MSSADQYAAPPDAFGFGRNWQDYVARHLTPARARTARESVTRLLGTIEGKSFLDIGAGSGLFSRAAYELGASRIVSVDVDPDSVASCRNLHQTAGAPSNWSVLQGSILDPNLPVESADIVYSWGVLHHTGDMWTAIRHARGYVKPGGTFCIAIYNDGRTRLLTSARWVKIKRFYNRSPKPVKRVIEGVHLLHSAQAELRSGNNPVRSLRSLPRGMDYWVDARDWLGGYPYEYATAPQIVEFVEGLGLECQRVFEESPTGFSNNEFVFTDPGSPSST